MLLDGDLNLYTVIKCNTIDSTSLIQSQMCCVLKAGKALVCYSGGARSGEITVLYMYVHAQDWYRHMYLELWH